MEQSFIYIYTHTYMQPTLLFLFYFFLCICQYLFVLQSDRYFFYCCSCLDDIDFPINTIFFVCSIVLFPLKGFLFSFENFLSTITQKRAFAQSHKQTHKKKYKHLPVKRKHNNDIASHTKAHIYKQLHMTARGSNPLHRYTHTHTHPHTQKGQRDTKRQTYIRPPPPLSTLSNPPN